MRLDTQAHHSYTQMSDLRNQSQTVPIVNLQRTHPATVEAKQNDIVFSASLLAVPMRQPAGVWEAGLLVGISFVGR